MKKFVAYMAAVFGLTTTAWAAIETQEAFVTACANAVSGDTLELGVGEFAIGPVDINGKTLTFKGQGATNTKFYIGNGGYDGNGGHGSSKTANMTFVDVTLDDLASNSGYLTGFTEAAGLTFRNVTFNVGFSNWGNKGGDVSFYNCTFNQSTEGKYNVQELRSANGTKYLFDGCTFNCTAEGRFINAYKQGGQSTKIEIVVKNCTFNNTGSSSKAVFNLKDESNGCTIDLTFVGTNTATGLFPSSAPSALFQTTSTGWGTVYLKDDDDAEPIKIWENNAKTTEWIDPNGYVPSTEPATEPEIKVDVPAVADVVVKDAEGAVLTGDDKTAVIEIVAAVTEAMKKPVIAAVEETNISAAVNEAPATEEAAPAVKAGVVAAIQAVEKPAGVTTEQVAEAVADPENVKSYVKVALVETKVAAAALQTIVYDIKPIVEVKVEEATIAAIIPNEQIETPIRFRLPVPASFGMNAKVVHESDAPMYLAVQGDENGKYVELASANFSQYSVSPLSDAYVAIIGEQGYETINAAFADVNNQTGDDVTIKILCDIKEKLGDDYELFKNVNLVTDIEGGVTVDFDHVSTDGDSSIETVGKTLTIAEGVNIVRIYQLFNGYYANRTDTTDIYGDAELCQLWAANDSIVNIYPTAHVVMGCCNGMVKLRWSGTLNVTGSANDSQNKQLSGGYIWTDYPGVKTVNLKDTYVSTAWLTVDDKPGNQGGGSLNLSLDNATLETAHESATGVSYGAAGGTISMKNGSLIIAGAIQNVTTITIDGASYGTEAVKVIDYTGSGTMTLADYATTVTVTGGEMKAEVRDNDLWIVPKTYVAQIGETTYETLAAAVAAATAGQTVMLIADVAFGEYDSVSALTIASDRDFTLDLAGYTISGTATRAATSQLILVDVGAKIKIIDSSEGEAGKITYVGHADPSWGYGTSTILNHGTLTIEGGMVENATVNGASYAIDNVNNNWGGNAGMHATLTIVGGKIKCDNGDQAVRNLSNSGENVSKAIFNMTGGEIVSGGFWGNIIANNSSAAYVDEAYEINISGGKINGMIDLISNGSNAKVNITGGEFNTSTLRLRKPNAGLTVTTPYVSISGGRWKIDALQDQTDNHIHMEVTGGIFTSDILKDFVASGYEITDNNDDVYTKIVQEQSYEFDVPVEGEQTIPVAVPESVFVNPVDKDGKPVDVTTPEQKAEYVNSEAANGMKVWQNVAMGVDGTQATNVIEPVEGVATTEEKVGKNEPVVITTPIAAFNAPDSVATKVEVKYNLLKGTMNSEGRIVWEAQPVAVLDTPRFVVDVKEDTGDTFWKIEAVFTSVK